MMKSRSKKFLLSLGGAFFVITILVAFTCSDAGAQVRPALVKNVEAPGRVPYQQMLELGTYLCYSPNECIASFSPVPAGKRLVLQHVSLMIAALAGSHPKFLAIGDCLSLNSCNVLILTPDFVNVPFSGEFSFWVIDRPVSVYYEAGQTPRLKWTVSGAGMGGANHNVSMVGYLIDANN